MGTGDQELVVVAKGKRREINMTLLQDLPSFFLSSNMEVTK